MSVFIKSNASPVNPMPGMPYVEKDIAIIRGVTKVMFDFSNPECYSGTGNLVGGTTQFRDLTVNGYIGKVQLNYLHIYAPVQNGMIGFLNGGETNGRSITLGGGLKFSASTKRSLVIAHFRVPKTGYAVSAQNGWFGAGNGGNEMSQWFVYSAADANGVLNGVKLRVRNPVLNGFNDLDIIGTALDKIKADVTQQWGFAMDFLPDGTCDMSIFIDGEKVAGANRAISAYNVYDSEGKDQTSSLFITSHTGYFSNTRIDFRAGRISAHDMTTVPTMSFTELLAMDRKGAQGYVY